VLFLVLLAIGTALTEPGKIVTEMETDYIRQTVDRAGLEGEDRRQVESVLERHREASRRERLGPSGWWAAGKAFERSPATIVLSLLNARANLTWLHEQDLAPVGKEKVMEVLARTAAGVAKAKIAPHEYVGLLEDAKIMPLSGEEPTRAMDTALDAAQVRRFAEKAEALAEAKEVPAARSFPDLAPLLERDLAWSLEEAKRNG
jgi:hypothetical protein